MMASLSDQIKKIQVTTTYQTFVKEYMALLWSLIIISIILNIYFPKNVYIHTILSLKAQTALCTYIQNMITLYEHTTRLLLSSVMRWNMFWVIALDISDPWIIGIWKYVPTNFTLIFGTYAMVYNSSLATDRSWRRRIWRDVHWCLQGLWWWWSGDAANYMDSSSVMVVYAWRNDWNHLWSRP